MIYYLDRQQWSKLWFTVINGKQWGSIDDDYGEEYQNRLSIWQSTFQKKYNLIYYENKAIVNDGFFGVFEGTEQHINWFIISEL